MGRLSLWVLLGLTMFALSLQDVQVSADVGPSESECRPYIEKAINELKTGETTESSEAGGGSHDEEGSAEDSGEQTANGKDTADAESAEHDNDKSEGDDDTTEEGVVETVETAEDSDEDTTEKTAEPSEEDEDHADTDDNSEGADKSEEAQQSEEGTEADDKKSGEATDDDKSGEEAADEGKSEEEGTEESDNDGKSGEDSAAKSAEEDEQEGEDKSQEDGDTGAIAEESGEDNNEETAADSAEEEDEKINTKHTPDKESEEDKEVEDDDTKEDDDDGKSTEQKDDNDDDDKTEEDKDHDDDDDDDDIKTRGKRSLEDDGKDEQASEGKDDESEENKTEETEEDKDGSQEEPKKDNDDDDDGSKEDDEKTDSKKDDDDEESGEADDDGKSEEESRPEDDLLLEVDIPENLRDRKHIDELLHLDDEFEESENAIDRVAEIILRDLKRIYENAVKPLETMYKYRDLSNRHFSDPEIFSKPLIVFMGPWSGGKSTIVNYLTNNEYTTHSLRSGAEPSPAYFNIVMYGNETEVLDGTQMAADWTFSGLQKFGQGLEDRLRGLKLPNKLLEKVNIVEIPGILEVRKQVSRLFPFNDACQWFIDRADIIFLVYDPAKLDVGPETEAILDQLKGREYQTRIILNKADTVKPEELLRVQSALIWNISPLMSSAQPPIMYTTSLWSHPYETSSPIRLLQAQERAFLRDIRGAIDKRIENKIASARRFAVRVRNHAKMVDCYLTTYYNHKTLFGNKKRISDQIIENPQNYHIYEGLSTLTNISRYDLPDPEVYRDFFRLNPLFEFKKLSETCTYFRGCPINKLDVAIAYDLPELVGKYKKMTEAALANVESLEQGKS